MTTPEPTFTVSETIESRSNACANLVVKSWFPDRSVRDLLNFIRTMPYPVFSISVGAPLPPEVVTSFLTTMSKGRKIGVIAHWGAPQSVMCSREVFSRIGELGTYADASALLHEVVARANQLRAFRVYEFSEPLRVPPSR